MLLVPDKNGRYATDIKTANKIKQILAKSDTQNKMRVVKRQEGKRL